MGSLSFRAPSANLAALVLGAVCLLGAGPGGAIFVTSLPSGADVWLDGTYVGRSPLVVDALAVHGTVALANVMLDGQPAQLGKDGIVSASAGVHEIAFGSGSSKFARLVTVYPQTRTDVVLQAESDRRSVVIAPADDYLPPSAYKIDGARLIMHYGGHDVIARLGAKEYTVDHRPAAFDSAPTVIGTRLYLPLELLTMLTANDKQ